LRAGFALQEATVNPRGTAFQPELIELMKAVLEDATATLPEAERTSSVKAEIASQILACAAKGERDPAALKIAALLAVVECSHYLHDISPNRHSRAEELNSLRLALATFALQLDAFEARLKTRRTKTNAEPPSGQASGLGKGEDSLPRPSEQQAQ
jgi:hypothetical protein